MKTAIIRFVEKALPEAPSQIQILLASTKIIEKTINQSNATPGSEATLTCIRRWTAARLRR